MMEGPEVVAVTGQDNTVTELRSGGRLREREGISRDGREATASEPGARGP